MCATRIHTDRRIHTLQSHTSVMRTFFFRLPDEREGGVRMVRISKVFIVECMRCAWANGVSNSIRHFESSARCTICQSTQFQKTLEFQVSASVRSTDLVRCTSTIFDNGIHAVHPFSAPKRQTADRDCIKVVQIAWQNSRNYWASAR